jgi:hypothetical protein
VTAFSASSVDAEIPGAMIALREELRQWKRALGWWSGLPAQEAFEFYTNRRVISDRQQEAEDRIEAEYPPTKIGSDHLEGNDK